MRAWRQWRRCWSNSSRRSHPPWRDGREGGGCLEKEASWGQWNEKTFVFNHYVTVNFWYLICNWYYRKRFWPSRWWQRPWFPLLIQRPTKRREGSWGGGTRSHTLNIGHFSRRVYQETKKPSEYPVHMSNESRSDVYQAFLLLLYFSTHWEE